MQTKRLFGLELKRTSTRIKAAKRRFFHFAVFTSNINSQTNLLYTLHFIFIGPVVVIRVSHLHRMIMKGLIRHFGGLFSDKILHYWHALKKITNWEKTLKTQNARNIDKAAIACMQIYSIKQISAKHRKWSTCGR